MQFYSSNRFRICVLSVVFVDFLFFFFNFFCVVIVFSSSSLRLILHIGNKKKTEIANKSKFGRGSKKNHIYIGLYVKIVVLHCWYCCVRIVCKKMQKKQRNAA